MNEGYIFLISCWLILILVSTQWLDGIWTKKHSPQKIRRWVLFFLFSIIITQSIYLPLTTSIAVNIGSVLLVTIVYGYYLIKDDSGFKLQMLAVILFLAIFYAVTYEMFYIDPILMIIPPVLMLPTFFSLFILLTTTSIKHQWFMMIGGLVLGETLHKIFMLKHVDMVLIGDAPYRNQLMVGLLSVTGATLVIRYVIKGFQFAIRLIVTRKQEG